MPGILVSNSGGGKDPFRTDMSLKKKKEKKEVQTKCCCRGMCVRK